MKGLRARENPEMRHFVRGVKGWIVRVEIQIPKRENSHFEVGSDLKRYPAVSEKLRAWEHREVKCFVRGIRK